MAGRRLNAFRLSGVTVALSASVLILISSQLPWVRTTSPIAFNYWIDVHVDNSGGLDINAVRVLVVAALMVATLAVMSLIPYLRVLCAVVVVIGGVCIALALGVMSEINRPVTGNYVGNIVSSASQRGPGAGIYVLIAGSALAIISGALTLLTPRTAPRRNLYGAAAWADNRRCRAARASAISRRIVGANSDTGGVDPPRTATFLTTGAWSPSTGSSTWPKTAVPRTGPALRSAGVADRLLRVRAGRLRGRPARGLRTP